MSLPTGYGSTCNILPAGSCLVNLALVNGSALLQRVALVIWANVCNL